VSMVDTFASLTTGGRGCKSSRIKAGNWLPKAANGCSKTWKTVALPSTLSNFGLKLGLESTHCSDFPPASFGFCAKNNAGEKLRFCSSIEPVTLPSHQSQSESKSMKKLTISLLATLLLSCTGTSAEEWGTITGSIVLDDDVPDSVLLIKKGATSDETGTVVKDPETCAAFDVYANDLLINKETKGIEHVFVYLYKKPNAVDATLTKVPATVIFDQKNCIFKPHTLVLQAGQTVEVLNSDPIGHNTHSNPIKNQQQNVLVPQKTVAGQGVLFPLNDRDSVPVKVNCDIHPSMLAYWLVMDHPYAAVTDEYGNFTIKNLPVGEHELRIWHERPGYVFTAPGSRKHRKYTVKAGDNPLEPVKVKLAELEAK
jgi:plastocyanin